MKAKCLFILISGLMAAAPTASAASGLESIASKMPSDYKRLKLGLWEETRRSERFSPPSNFGAMDMSGFSPEERARVEAVLKRQAEERKARGNAPEVSTHTKRTCMTAQKLEKNMRGMDLTNGDRQNKDVQCNYQVKQSTASRLVVAGECMVADAGPKAGSYAGGGKFTSEIAWEIKSPESTIASTSSEGKMGSASIKSRDVVESRWISADCGKVK